MRGDQLRTTETHSTAEPNIKTSDLGNFHVFFRNTNALFCKYLMKIIWINIHLQINYIGCENIFTLISGNLGSVDQALG